MIYAWNSKYGGMEVSEAEEVKRLRDGNARFKSGNLGTDRKFPILARADRNSMISPPQSGSASGIPAQPPEN